MLPALARMSTYFHLRGGHQLCMRSFIVAQDKFAYTLLKECGLMRRAQTFSDWDMSDRISVHLGCFHTCTWSCPLVIGSPKTHVNARCERGLCQIMKRTYRVCCCMVSVCSFGKTARSVALLRRTTRGLVECQCGYCLMSVNPMSWPCQSPSEPHHALERCLNSHLSVY